MTPRRSRRRSPDRRDSSGSDRVLIDRAGRPPEGRAYGPRSGSASVVVVRILGLVALLAAGCLEPNLRITDDWPIDRPEDWDRSPELVAYDGFRAHSADQEVAAAPEDPGTSEPAGCAAYQDGRRDRFDTCEVRGPDTRFGRDEGPWTIHATWDGRGEDLIATSPAGRWSPTPPTAPSWPT